jgi:hypothetical protein
MDLIPPLQWAAQSVALTLANKAVFSSALFDFPWLVLGIESVTVVASLTLLSLARGRTPCVSRALAAEMLLPALLFALYNFSFARALRFMSLPAYTVVKSIAPLAVTVLESAAFRDPIPAGVYLAIAVSAAANVLTFDFDDHVSRKGYAWSVFHVLTHICFVLSLRCCTQVYHATDKGYMAALLSLPFVFPMALLNVEAATFLPQVETLPSTMLLPLAASFGLSAGCAVSVLAAYEASSFIALRYLALFNKIAVVVLGAILFDADLTPAAWLGVALSIVSGYIFVYAKTKVAPSPSASMPRPIVSSPSLEMLLPSAEDRAADGGEEHESDNESDRGGKQSVQDVQRPDGRNAAVILA